MKKTLTLITISASILIVACSKNNPKPAVKTADTYWPTTAGTTFTYKSVDLSGTGISTTLMLKDSTLIVNKYYHGVSFGGDTAVEYLYEGKHLYALRQVRKTGNLAMEYSILNDTASVGYTWTTPPNETGTYAGSPTRFINKIIEKNITKTINGKIYNNVIHTLVQLQFGDNQGINYTNAERHDFYFAKNIGMIEDIDTNGSTVLYTTDLVSYVIK